MLAFWRDPTGQILRIAREHGDVASFRFGPELEVLVNDPEGIRSVLVTDQRSFMKGQALQEAKRVLGDGLLTSEGEEHLRQRRLIQPIFHHRRIGAYGGTMTELADRLQARWSDGEQRDVHEDMTRLTLAIVGRTLFDADVEGEAREIGEALNVALEAVNTLTFPFGHVWERLPLPGPRRFRQASARLDETIYRLIAERRAGGLTGEDLLSLLLRARDETGGEGMSDRQVRDEAMTIFLAGHETTANLLTWIWYLLSQDPGVESRLHEELDRVVGSRLPIVDDLPALEYAERVIDEALRLYPPVWLFGRRALVDYELGGYAIPGRSMIVLSQWVTHHDPRWFPDPWRFDPERWAPAEGGRRGRSTRYFPFGGGTRICIGEAFARMEAKLVLATIAGRWRLRLVPGHRAELRPRITLRPRGGMPMTVTQRGQGG